MHLLELAIKTALCLGVTGVYSEQLKQKEARFFSKLINRLSWVALYSMVNNTCIMRHNEGAGNIIYEIYDK